jgi:membrane protease YdiL (CAAX protease family)
LLLCWEAVVRANAIPPYILPAPTLIAATLWRDLPSLLPSLWFTVRITVGALLLAVVGGVLLAAVFAMSRRIETALFPIAIVLQVTPIVAIAPLIIIWVNDVTISLLICAWAVGEISNSYLEGIFGDLEVQEPVRMFQESKSIAHLSLSILMACIAAPVVEEFLFRGYMYGTLRRLTNPVFAAVIIGGLFAVVHGNLPALLPLWVFSILLCLAYEFTRCLWVPVGMHVFFNAANIVLMLMPESAE